jgi:hypothetical protein
MFGHLFKKNAAHHDAPEVETEPRYLVAQLNARLQPMHRGELFEDPLDDALQQLGVGSVTGGGTEMSESGEVAHCDIEIKVAALDEDAVRAVISCLERLGAPLGSQLRLAAEAGAEAEERKLSFGVTEGMAVYLNGTDLPDEVYARESSDAVYSELERLLDGIGEIYSHWQAPTETALYLYGNSFKDMHESVASFLATHPLCQKCRIVQIA